ncbi:trifunctional histidinol dehydrogenase [Malassezia vespertilionis]|uniref:Histidine biosynthesis trifunctional protein n=1 Tax=Malassezia vespertilionis TaxID=2020962 RepID=A0A2N1JCX3_9BASI|nr:trifunctional histidinol dehydrogenase [Malassezia vespertilionis]PKI84389.1 His4p [Malassezia vespertilionis]WFD06360.1 trifunctional histidinol dehydrogenase [Malassezia vespertilionis]
MLQQSAPLIPYLDPTDDAAVFKDSELYGAIKRSAPLLVRRDAVASFGRDALSNAAFLVELDAATTYDDALALLNAGVDAIVVAADSELLQQFDAGVIAERVIVQLDEDAQAPSDVAGVLVQCASVPPLGTVQRFVDAMETHVTGKPVLLKAATRTDSVAQVHKTGATLVLPTTALSVDGSKMDYVDALLSTMVSDRQDGLFPTVVVSDTGSTSLGLVYSSRESIRASLLTGSAHYQSRKRGIWHKGATSGATQNVVSVQLDCDNDALEFRVEQHAGKRSVGFCHLTDRASCFGSVRGLAKLEHTLRERKANAPPDSYTARLFNDQALLGAKIREEAQELVEATDQKHIAFEAADLLYFAMVRCIAADVGLAAIEKSLDAKSLKVTRRKGDAKPAFVHHAEAPAPIPADQPIRLPRHSLNTLSAAEQTKLLRRPGIRTDQVLERVRPILAAVKERGDAALLEYTAQLDRVKLDKTVRLPPFQTDADRDAMDSGVREAINVAYNNVLRFHAVQSHVAAENMPPAGAPSADFVPQAGKREVMQVETMPGVVCTRFPRAIERVGIYVPGGSAVLPSTALMLGVPAKVAGCKTIVLATPPRADGSIAPEVLYVADKVGVDCLVCAGGAQAVAAMAYGTPSVPKVDKIAGPGNQYVTAAKMLVQNEVEAMVSIDMPAGPSEVLVIADEHANPAFVASDLLSQAEHGPDSQVVLVAIDLSAQQLSAIENEVDCQARVLPRVDVVRQAIDKSVTILVQTREQAMDWSNRYAPEHLILHANAPEQLVPLVENAGSVFIGPWSPESCGDYASGTNHTLPTYGYARQYSGVSTSTFQKQITAQMLDAAGLQALGPHVVRLAECEGLEAHANAVRVRLQHMAKANEANGV